MTMAIALSRLSSERQDIRVDIYESARRFTEIGAGVGLFLRVWKVLKSLGLEESLRNILPSILNENEIGERPLFSYQSQDEGS